jgi:hypothetical protein
VTVAVTWQETKYVQRSVGHGEPTSCSLLHKTRRDVNFRNHVTAQKQKMGKLLLLSEIRT